MVIPNAAAYGVLVSVGLLILLASVFVFMRLGRPPKRIEEKDRPPMPLGWPTIPSEALPPRRRSSPLGSARSGGAHTAPSSAQSCAETRLLEFSGLPHDVFKRSG